ncbi:transcription factor E4F1 isoform X2 [Xenopus tropicalis]|uniref:Transcription factor E4F1 n=1 Tax=Xenopus tropicalis TaxID=8364 RepID=A0A8J0SYM2_XENTR|nr:transcription factor E4F1 isoform X2 [Xenopus tropicalis]|eukprot:XP_012825833.1 PREDICTED: transcription factor E4F1 isoform X2 [Xenopus tropicalis]
MSSELGAGAGEAASSAGALVSLEVPGTPLITCFKEEDEDDVHKCGRCQAEFTSLEEFVHHKIQKICLRAPDPNLVSTGAALNGQEVVPSIEETETISQVIVESTEDVSNDPDEEVEDIKDILSEDSALGGQRDVEELEVEWDESRGDPDQDDYDNLGLVTMVLNERGRYVCQLCDKTFKTANILRAHMITHSTKKEFECKLCGNSFRTKGSLIRHNRRHTDERPYVCSKCGKSFRESGALTRHFRSLTPCTEKIRLNMCKEIMISKEEYALGLQKTEKLVPTKDANSKVPGASCQLASDTKDSSQVIHLLTDANGNILQEVHIQVQAHDSEPVSLVPEAAAAERCAVDGELSSDSPLHHMNSSSVVIETVSMQDVESEEIIIASADEPQSGEMDEFVNGQKTIDGTADSDDPALKCPKCNTICISSNALSVHLKGHEGCMLYSCEVCGREFLKRHLLRKHQECHFSERKYKCGECGKMYKTVAHVKGHMRVHSDDRPYPCPKCGKRYKTKNAQQVHSRTHLDEKPYVCQYCPNSFREKGSLVRHIRHHTGEKPFKCHKCGRGFAEHGTLNRHLKTKGGCMLLLSLKKKPDGGSSAEESSALQNEETAGASSEESEEPHTVLVEFSSVVADTQEYIIETAAEDSEASEAAELIQDSGSQEVDGHIYSVVQQLVSDASPGQQIIVRNVSIDGEERVEEVPTTDTIAIATPELLTEQVALTLASAIEDGAVVAKEEPMEEQQIPIPEEVEMMEHAGEFVIESHDGDLEVQTVIV